MKILIISPETYFLGRSPLAKAVFHLIKAYRNLGIETAGFSPYCNRFLKKDNYRPLGGGVEKIRDEYYEIFEHERVDGIASGEWESVTHNKDFLIRHDDYFDRDEIYSEKEKSPYNDNHLRFSFLISAALDYCAKTNFIPDAIHVHEWSGIAGAFTKTVYKDFFGEVPVWLTVHNILYDCTCNPQEIEKIGLPPEDFDVDGYEFWGKVSLLKAAILYADKVLFTSMNYLFYILNTNLPNGMQGFLELYKSKLIGIQSGIDYEFWGTQRVVSEVKKSKKEELKCQLGLSEEECLLMYVQIDSNEHSIEPFITILASVLELNLQLIVEISHLHPNYDYLLSIQKLHSDKFALLPLTNDSSQSRMRLYSSDLFFIMHISEPSSAIIFKALAAGSIPLTRHTRFPLIWAIPYEPNSESKANSFIVEDYSPDQILYQIRLAESVFSNDQIQWQRIVENASNLRITWEDTAKNYLLLLPTQES